ncbi:MAG: anthranilate synthase component I family protein [Pirellulaceae bacterium]|nr:anthranilate synthase component I family protein [Pirellulaceae bacterium]
MSDVPAFSGSSADPLPWVHELSAPPLPEHAFRRLCGLPHCLFLDSAVHDPQLGRYSFLAADPCCYWELPADGQDALGWLQCQLSPFESARRDELPPFQGGAAGLLAYDLAFGLERLPRPRFDEFQVPALAMGLYDVVLAYDHVLGRAWVISQGWPERDADRRRQRAERRAREFLGWLNGPAALPPVAAARPIDSEELAPRFPAAGPAGLTSSFSADGYLDAVRRAVEYIFAGDVFQVNLAQRLLYPQRDDSVSLYLRLRSRNPAPFAGYFDTGSFQIVSASPERFVSVRQRQVETRPIKGTRRRSTWPEADLFAGDELLASEKDRAENVMIVDLLRNDLSRVCLPDSVRVSALCRLEVYQFVQHLVSVVEGTLRPDRTPMDLLRAAFPGGSITGAPKVRAMEIISELEPTARGAYCGCLGYIGLDGSLDLSILIRTITAGRGWWQMPVGGGIVAQSDPQRELEETWHKAAGLLQALC